jgi:hypothetical protein
MIHRSRTPVPLMRGTRNAASIALAVVALALLLIIPAAASAACPSMEVFGVRGSGQTQNEAGGYGSTVQDVVQRITKAAPDVHTEPINYTAIGVDWWDPSYYGWKYQLSVDDGDVKLYSAIQSFLKSGCSGTYIYLIGYSQGAQVAGDVYQALSSAQQKRIGGVALIGDPEFKGSQGEPVNWGSYNPTMNGVYPLRHRTLTGGETSAVRSYCANGDPVCNSSPSNILHCVIPILKDSCPHTHYTTEEYDGVGYTEAAAAFLVSQWRLLGPKTVSVGSRKSILVFGSGDYTDDPSGMANLVSALRSYGYSVTQSPTLPNDLSSYGQVWWYGLDQLTSAQENELVDYARSGGSLYLSGEWSDCCEPQTNQDTVAAVFNSLVVTVGGIQYGPDGEDRDAVNPSAIDGVATLPNTLTTFTGSYTGSIAGTNIGENNFVFAGSDGSGIVGVWGSSEVVGGGRLAIVMDVNWIETEYGNIPEADALVGNLAYFLSGADG